MKSMRPFRTLRSLARTAAAFGSILGIGILPGAVPARGQGVAPGSTLDPSVRATGMGRAGVAVFWGVDPNYWSNPALGGYLQGIRANVPQAEGLDRVDRTGVSVFFDPLALGRHLRHGPRGPR
jgi:hypothetical protein